jgi:hypothetical protein
MNDGIPVLTGGIAILTIRALLASIPLKYWVFTDNDATKRAVRDFLLRMLAVLGATCTIVGLGRLLFR